MKLYRLHNTKFPIELSGEGAAICGGRWNSKGTEIIYCAEHRSLAFSELAVHIKPGKLPKGYVMMEVDVPDSIKIDLLDVSLLDSNWNNFPYSFSTQHFGDEFVENNLFCLLKVPSAVINEEYNYLINPHHADFIKISIASRKDFNFDDRFFKAK